MKMTACPSLNKSIGCQIFFFPLWSKTLFIFLCCNVFHHFCFQTFLWPEASWVMCSNTWSQRAKALTGGDGGVKKLHNYSFFLESWHGNKSWTITKSAASVRDVFQTQLCTPLLPQRRQKPVDTGVPSWGQVCYSVQIPTDLSFYKYFLDLALWFLQIFFPLALNQLESYTGVK